MKLTVILSLVILSSCSWFHQEPLTPKVVVTTKIVYPSIPNFNAPQKVELRSIKFDWPRDANVYSVRNTSKCISKFKEIYASDDVAAFRLDISDESDALELESNADFWSKCSVQSIDVDSNLYIGVSESEYKSLINNTNMLIGRERMWNNILDRINRMLTDWRNSNTEVTK